MSKEADNGKAVFSESPLRSLVKTIVYRIISIIGMGTLSWLITRDFMETVSITIVIQIFLTVLYYSSERVWNRIDWGRKRGSD